jgi:hypothetical protein
MNRDLLLDATRAQITVPDRDTFRVQPSLVQVLRILTVFAGIGSAVSCLFSIWWWYFSYRHFGPAVVWRWSSIAIYASLLFLFLTTLSGIAAMRSGQFEVSIAHDGISFRRGKAVYEYPWEQIAYLRTTADRYWLPVAGLGTRSTLWLYTDTGRKLRLSDRLERFDGFVEAVKSRLYPLYLQKYREQLNRGQAIDFGGVTLEPTGLRIKKKLILWRELEAVSLDHGKVVLRSGGPSRKREIVLRASKIYNVDLCIQLIQNIELTS